MNNRFTGRVLILGKLPPPYFGPAIATEIILNSELKSYFELYHLDTAINRKISGIGRISIKKIFSGIYIYIRLIKILLKIKPGVILVPISQSTIGFYKDSIFVLIAHFFNCKVIIHLRGSNFNKWVNSTSSLNKHFVSLVLKKSDAAIVLGKKLRYIFEGYYHSGKIFVVPNGANYNFPVKQNKSTLQIIYFANFIEDKGFFEFLESINILSNGLMDIGIKFIAAGDWTQKYYEQKCLSFIEKNNLNIEVLPTKSGLDKMQLFINADIFVFTPNKPEGHPWVIIEAMAAGLPIISTDQGAITESVIDGLNGFIVDSYAPEQIAEKMVFLINNQEIRKKMGEESRRLYETHFTEKIMVDNLINVFNTVIGDE